MRPEEKLFETVRDFIGVSPSGCDQCGKQPTELVALWRDDRKRFCSGKCAVQWGSQHPQHPLKPVGKS